MSYIWVLNPRMAAGAVTYGTARKVWRKTRKVIIFGSIVR